MNSKSFYITTPIYYVNGPPHVGTALTTIACDVIARYHAMQGRTSRLITGTDENGAKIQDAAENAGLPPDRYVEGLSSAFRQCWQELNIGFSDFIRTTEPRHIHAVQEFFRRLMERGFVYKDTYEGWYSVSDETFYRDADVENGVSKETGKPVIRVKEDNYFFKLSAFSSRLLAHIESNPEFLLPDFRKNEVKRFIEEGLRDMCITRPNRGWGIAFPGDASKVIYVWFDALISYLASTGWPDAPDWQNLWPADVHLMGKEIFVRFHATLWPAMLMALDLPLPRQVFAHGFWTVPGLKPGEKAGKSTGGLPHPIMLTAFLAERTGATQEGAVEALRYILCREMNFGNDSEFTVENFLKRYNTDLANDVGNLLNRTISMMIKYYDGIVPACPRIDEEISALAMEITQDYEKSLAEFRLNVALESSWRLVKRMNKYIDERAPWSLAKAAKQGDEESSELLALTLTTCLEAIRMISIWIEPFMPTTSRQIRRQLDENSEPIAAQWSDLQWGLVQPGAHVATPSPIFPRIQDLALTEETLILLGAIKADRSGHDTTEEAEAKKEQRVTETTNTESTGSATMGTVPGTPVTISSKDENDASPITIDDFMKVQLKVGEVLAAEPVPNATKLLRLTVQLGEEDTRTILAGIAEFYRPDELIGRQVIVVANLQPRKMRGIESQGMLLAADLDGRAILLKPDEEVPLGSRVR